MSNQIGTFLSFIASLMLITIILALPLMLLWNWLMPIIFNLPEITFWQALGLNVLSGIQVLIVKMINFICYRINQKIKIKVQTLGVYSENTTWHVLRICKS